MILDGSETAAQFAQMLKAAKTILWNGPVGAFEVDQFGKGTEVLSKAIAKVTPFDCRRRRYARCGGQIWYCR